MSDEFRLTRRDEVGGNNPPSFREELQSGEAYATLAGRQARLEIQALSVPAEVKTDEDVEKVSAWVLAARKLSKDADTERERVKKPYLDAGRDVDAVFGAFRDDLKSRAEAYEARSKPFLLAKQRAAEEAARAAAAAARQKAEEEREKARKAEEAKIEAQRRQDEEARRLRDAENEAAAQQSAAEAQAEADEQEVFVADTTAAQVAIDANEGFRQAMQDEHVAQLTADSSLERAEWAEKEAEKAEKALTSGHRLSRTAGGGGAAVAQTVWIGKITDGMKLLASLGPLGQHLLEDQIKAAIDRAAKKDRPDIPGVEWVEDAKVKTTALRRN